MQATVVFVVGLGESAAALRRLAGDVDEVVKRLAEPGATAPIVPPAAVAAQRGGAVAARGVPRRGRAGRGRRRGRAASRASRSPATRRASRRCCRASGSPPRRSPTCASWPAAARGCTAPATRRSRPSTCLMAGRMPASDQNAGRMPAEVTIDRSAERWAQYGEKPDYAGLLTFAGRALHRGPGGARRASTWRSSARRWTTSSPTARARGSRRARSARRAARPARTSRPRSTRSPSCGWSTSATRPVIPADPGVSHAAIEATVGQVLAAGALPVVLGGDHSITEPARARVRGGARPGRRRALRHPHRHGRRGLRRRALARHVHAAASSTAATSTARRYAQIGLRGYWPGEDEFAWQAERGITSLFMHDVRDLGIREVVRARDRGGRARARLPDRRRRRARPGVRPAAPARPSPAA